MRNLFLFFTAFIILQTNTFAAVPTAAFTFDTDIDILNATSSREKKIRAAEDLIREVIATEEFRSAVLNHTYNGKKTFVNNEGLSNLSIYNKILEGAEVLNKVKDNAMDLDIKTYYESSNTVGYTMTSSSVINMNTKYLDKYTAAQVSRNMMHEWLHKLGFSHAVNYSTSRDYSVPYGIGSIMERLAKKVSSSSSSSSGSSSLGAPSNLTLSQSSSSVTLKWGAASGAVKYKVYRQLSGSSSIYLQSTTTSLSYTQSKPSKDATYYVRSVDSSGNTVKSNVVSYKESAALEAPSNLTLSQSSSSVTLKWGAASGAVKYKVYRQLSGSSSIYLQSTTTSLSFSQSRPSKDATYYVRSVDSSGNTVKSNVVSYKASGTLGAPTNLTLSEGSSSVTLRWGAASGAVKYKVYRQLSGSSTIYLQSTTTSLSYTQSKPSRDATYYVRSVDSSGKTVKSNVVSYQD